MDDTQKTELVYKKYLDLPVGFVNTFYAADTALGSSTKNLNTKTIRTNPPPDTAPTDLGTAVIITNGSYQQSNTYTYMRKYTLTLSSIQTNKTFWYASTDPNDPEGTNLCRGAIPSTFDPLGSYNITVKANGTTVSANYTDYPWNFDVDAGVLTFYPLITIPTPITITFWRYVGNYNDLELVVNGNITTNRGRVYFNSTTAGSGDYYYIGCGGVSGDGYLLINWFNASTGITSNPFQLTAEGLLWIGATAQTGCGVKISDRTNTTFWEIYPSNGVLTFDYNAVGATKFRCTTLGQFDILGTSASLNLIDRNTQTLFWTMYHNVSILRWYYGGADRMYLTSAGALGLDSDLGVGVANPATTTITMTATTLCRIATTLATMGTINMGIGYTDLSSGTVSGNTATFEVSTADIVFYSNSTLFNGTPMIFTRFGDCSIYHYNGAGLGSATYYVSCYWNSGSPIGGIRQVNATTVSFPTTSDRRLKEQIEDLTEEFVDGIFNTLKPRSYVWKGSQEPAIGFIADELQAVMPDCVYGETDAVNDKGEPVYQVADCASPSMIAVLVAELQFLRKRVAALELKCQGI